MPIFPEKRCLLCAVNEAAKVSKGEAATSKGPRAERSNAATITPRSSKIQVSTCKGLEFLTNQLPRIVDMTFKCGKKVRDTLENIGKQ